MRCAWRSVKARVPVFKRLHHQKIARVLGALDARLLHGNRCLFGGGTAIALRHGEYRESVDIDFLVSDVGGYRKLRQLLTSPGGTANILRDGAVLTQMHEVRADQYGVRTMLDMEGSQIKFEIVLEGRIELAPPQHGDIVCGIATLTALDLATSKLLANCDRWADDGVFSRDLIDLAMMEPTTALLRQAIAKAERPYGAAVVRDLAQAIEQLKSRPGRLERCMEALRIDVAKAALWQRVRRLRRALPAGRAANTATALAFEAPRRAS